MKGFNGWAGLERLVPELLQQASWLRPRYPLVGVELREDAVVVSRVKAQRDGYHLAGHARSSLPEGLFTSSMTSPRIKDAPVLVRTIGEALADAGAESSGRVSLALPDTTARVSLLDFQELPSSHEQISELVRWRLKKSVPFELEDSQISWEELGRAEDGRVQMLVAVAPSDGMRQIENLFEALGVRVGLVDLASFNVFNVLRLDGLFEEDGGTPGGTTRDLALLSATPTYFSLMITRGSRLIFYRAKSYHVRGGYRGGDSLRVVQRELRTTLSYYEEHLLGEGIGTLHVRVVGIEPDGLLETAKDLGCSDIRPVGIGRVIPEIGALSEEEAMELLPSVGLALRREP